MWPDQTFDQLPFLVVEDSADDLFLLQKALHEISVPNPHVTVSSVSRAIEYLEQSSKGQGEHPFPVVLFLDLLLPDVGGIEVLEWLNRNPHPPLPVVLHTGVEDETLLQHARDLGATFYLPKGTKSEAVGEVFRRARAEWEQNHALYQGA
jgi:CheY-like chemotaxis protein